MNFSPSEPNASSASGMGTIRTMQGDLKNIRASKNKVQPLPKIDQLKPLENKPIFEVFGVSKEPIVKKDEKIEQESFVLKREAASVGVSSQGEQKIEKAITEVVPVEKIIKKVEKKVVKPVVQLKDKRIEEEGSGETLSKISNIDKIQERIRMSQEKIKLAQEKIRPIIANKEVAAPENILAVSESENKTATQYVASLSKSAQSIKDEEQPVNRMGIEEEGEYLPPELRLYRSTGNNLVDFKKESSPLTSSNKPKAEISQINDDILRKTDSFGSGKKLKKMLKFVILILIIVAGAYLIVIKKTDLSFVFQLLPKQPIVTPVLTSSPTPAISEKIDIKNIIYIKDTEDLNSALVNLKNQEYPPINIISYSINSTPVTGEALLNKLNIAIPSKVKNSLNINNVSLLYFAINKRLGLAIETKDMDALKTEMKVWETALAGGEINPIPYTLSPLLLGNFFELNQNIVFKSGNYKDVIINYTNLPDSYRAIDYGIVKNFLVITTSKENMVLTIDEINR